MKQLILTLTVLIMSSSVFSDDHKPASPVKLQSFISTLEGHEGIIADVEIAPNGALPAHQHPGDEFLYMLTGTVELSRRDLPTITLNAGDAFQIPAGTIHSPRGGPEGARAIVFRVHPTGEPVAVPADE